MVMKMRVSLVERGGEISGQVGYDGDNLFLFECLALITEIFAKKAGVTPDELLRDASAAIRKENKNE